MHAHAVISMIPLMITSSPCSYYALSAHMQKICLARTTEPAYACLFCSLAAPPASACRAPLCPWTARLRGLASPAVSDPSVGVNILHCSIFYPHGATRLKTLGCCFHLTTVSTLTEFTCPVNMHWKALCVCRCCPHRLMRATLADMDTNHDSTETPAPSTHRYFDFLHLS